MARPSKFKRDQAVEVVMNEIWSKGYGACSVKALAKTLDITRSSFYNAFGSREALFQETLQLYFERSPDRALAAATPDYPVRKLLTETFRAASRARASDDQARGCLVINSVAELSSRDPVLGPVMKQAVLENLARIRQILEWGVLQGEVKADDDLHGKALALQNLLIGLNAMCKVVTNEEDLWAAAKTTLRGLDLYDETHPAAPPEDPD